MFAEGVCAQLQDIHGVLWMHPDSNQLKQLAEDADDLLSIV